MKSTFLLGLLASTSLTSARIHSGTYALAVAASLISGPLTALAVPVWTSSSSRLGPRQANSTTSAVAGTYTVVPGDTLNAIAAAEGITTLQLEDANPDVVPTELQVGQVLNLPASANSNATSSSTNGTSTSTSTTGTSSVANGTSTSDSAPAATQSNSVDASDLGEGFASTSPQADTGTTQQNTTSSCGGHHHHHHNGTASGNGQSQNGTTSTGHHTHNGTTTDDDANNSTSVATGSSGCTAHHHHNGTAGATTAASFFIPATATASALAVALTSSAATGNFEGRSLGSSLAMLHRI
jgi:murein DD-endopeptidase MepM/ murein hydrolase activator NlpD